MVSNPTVDGWVQLANAAIGNFVNPGDVKPIGTRRRGARVVKTHLEACFGLTWEVGRVERLFNAGRVSGKWKWARRGDQLIKNIWCFFVPKPHVVSHHHADRQSAGSESLDK